MTDGLSNQICTVLFSSCVGMVSPTHGPCPSCLAPCCPADISNILLSLQLPNGQKGTHVPSGTLILLGIFPLLSTPNLLDTVCLPLLKTQKPEHVQTDRHFHSGNFSVLLLSSLLPPLCWTGSVWHLSVTMPSSCVSRQILSELDTWFRRRCQRPQLTHKRAIRPAHCSRSHFVPAPVLLSEDMSQRIKAAWLNMLETRRVEWYSAWN